MLVDLPEDVQTIENIIFGLHPESQIPKQLREEGSMKCHVLHECNAILTQPKSEWKIEGNGPGTEK